MGKKFSLKGAIGGGVLGSIVGQGLFGGVGSIAGGAYGAIKDSGGDPFQGSTTAADPEGARLKAIKMQGAEGEGEALNLFRQRMNADTAGIIGGDIEREDVALAQSERDAQMKLQESIAQKGLGQSSLGLQASANLSRETARERALNRAGFRKRLDEENLSRLSKFRDVAAGTLSGQDIPIRFNETKEDSFLTSIGKGIIGGGIQAGTYGLGRRLGGAGKGA